MLVVDDALLISVLAGAPTGKVAEAAGNAEVFTTGSWYYRLAAALHASEIEGALTRVFRRFEAPRQVRVVAALDRLPDEIGLLPLRELVPVMAALPVRRRLNLLHAEALAAASVLGAGIAVATESELMRQGCEALSIDLAVVPI